MQLRQDRHAVQHRHRQIEQHEARTVEADRFQRLAAIRRRPDFVAVVLQANPEHRLDVPIVVHDQDALGWHNRLQQSETAPTIGKTAPREPAHVSEPAWFRKRE